MSIYQEILTWSENKDPFLRDSLRRIITSTSLSNTDISELIELLKKDCGDETVSLNAIPFASSHIPTLSSSTNNFPKLINIKNPKNICALYDEGNIEFSNTGLTVVYGKNGSGKSSYTRILKKLCWSRNPSTLLKKNVFNPSDAQQKVEFVYEVNELNKKFSWIENAQSNSILNSIFVFDSECADVYINSENPTEYKPVGMDILEKLIETLNEMGNQINASISSYTTQKPVIPQSLSRTNIAQWYSNIENLKKCEIDSFTNLSDEESLKQKNLTELLLSTQNPQLNISNLNNKHIRVKGYLQTIEFVESKFSSSALEKITEVRQDYERISAAYKVATEKFENANTLEGFGTSPWRTLWESAKNYAHSAKLSDGNNFPSGQSLEKCVLCQQDLSEEAKHRLQMFNQFVLDDVSVQLSKINEKRRTLIEVYKTLDVPTFDNLKELENDIPKFSELYLTFYETISNYKNSIIKFLESGFPISSNVVNLISPLISRIIPTINAEIDSNKKVLNDKNQLDSELLELQAKEFLYQNKSSILQYFDEYSYKKWLTHCKSKLSTNSISRKIGELMENQAVTLQHQEFISHLNALNPELANKVQITKTKTSQGKTFQKCSMEGINEPINSIFSEGEQKVIALSNFLAECTIDNRGNSIIFDDPVTSLDTDYRDLIAEKIVDLSKNRQLIVFTHDLSFFRLLKDTHKTNLNAECTIIGIDKYHGKSGIVTDEIPYLAKNVQERVNSIRGILRECNALDISDFSDRETKLESVRKRFRMLLERTVEDVLSNRTYERFSKNVKLKKGNLSSYIVTEKADIDFLLGLYSKYSVSLHDGGTSTLSQIPQEGDIQQDITDYSNWKDTFIEKRRTFQNTHNYR